MNSRAHLQVQSSKSDKTVPLMASDGDDFTDTVAAKNMETWKTIVGSLRKHGYDGHFIFGVHKDMPPEEEAYLQAMNVTY